MARKIVTNTTLVQNRLYVAGAIVDADVGDPVVALDDQGAFLIDEGFDPLIDKFAAIARLRKDRGATIESLDLLMRGAVVEGGGLGVHKLGGALHSADTLAALNAKVSDATLDDQSAARPPTAHTHVEAEITDLVHTDAAAIHDNVDAEISAVAEKTVPVGADLVLIEDSAAANAKKRVQVGNLPGGGTGDVTAAASLTDNALVRGDGGAKGVQTSGWQLTDADQLASDATANPRFVHDVATGRTKMGKGLGGVDASFEMLFKCLAAGGDGVRIMCGEVEGDIALSITDQDGTLVIVDVHADDGQWVFGATYAATLLANGFVFGLDNQLDANSTRHQDINTQNGGYRVAGNLAIANNGIVTLPSFTVAGVPSAAPAGQTAFITDETGGAVTAFSDGTNWRRTTDRAIIS